MKDLEREHGWWLLVDGSEQSYVDTVDPTHLEFEYVQLIAHAVQAVFAGPLPLTALHLGGGLCTLPRWVAARFPGSHQVVAEHNAQIATLARTLGDRPEERLNGIVDLRIDDAARVLGRVRRASIDLVVCDLYDGPQTVVEFYTATGVARLHRVLADGGIVIANLSDAAPFSMTKVIASTFASTFASVALLAEPAVLRGRRSGNVVIVASDRELPVATLVRRTAGSPVRGRVVAGEALEAFTAGHPRALASADIPASGESPGLEQS